MLANAILLSDLSGSHKQILDVVVDAVVVPGTLMGPKLPSYSALVISNNRTILARGPRCASVAESLARLLISLGIIIREREQHRPMLDARVVNDTAVDLRYVKRY